MDVVFGVSAIPGHLGGEAAQGPEERSLHSGRAHLTQMVPGHVVAAVRVRTVAYLPPLASAGPLVSHQVVPTPLPCPCGPGRLGQEFWVGSRKDAPPAAPDACCWLM